jgi:hypothetical protein
MDEEDLVVLMVDDRAEFGAHAGAVGGSELALEDGVLEVVTPGAHGFEDEAEALVVRDVVADQVGLAHMVNYDAPLSTWPAASSGARKLAKYLLGLYLALE